uniref:Uncharacterized protein n=1 Tax=Ixodes ricinus TaxID=34613 RepID=A0A6B0UX00_IXORI
MSCRGIKTPNAQGGLPTAIFRTVPSYDLRTVRHTSYLDSSPISGVRTIRASAAHCCFEYETRATAAHKVRTAGRFFQIPGLQRVLVAFWHALVARARSRLTRCRCIIEGRTLALEVGQLKDLPAVLILSLTVAMLLGLYISGRGWGYGGIGKEIYS